MYRRQVCSRQPRERALEWFEENNPFDHNRDKSILVSFSTGFTSTADDADNAERATEVGRKMQIKLDGKSVTSTMNVKFKVKALSSLRKISKVNVKKIDLVTEVVQSTGNFRPKGYDNRYKFRVSADSHPLIVVQQQRL